MSTVILSAIHTKVLVFAHQNTPLHIKMILCHEPGKEILGSIVSGIGQAINTKVQNKSNLLGKINEKMTDFSQRR